MLKKVEQKMEEIAELANILDQESVQVSIDLV